MKDTPKREVRLPHAKKWIKTYRGKNLIKGYAKKFHVDKLCAVKELRILGIEVSAECEKRVVMSIEARKKQRLAIKLKHEQQDKEYLAFDSDEYFAVIIGYTSGGCPYGITHEQMEEINNNAQ